MAADNCKVLIAVIFLTATSLLALGASVGGPKSTLEVLIYHVIPQKVSNATQQMKTMYPLITSSSFIQVAIVMLPNLNMQSCSSNQKLEDNLAIAYKKLFEFKSPLYMTFSYEQNQTGSQHALLTQVLKDTSYYINGSTFTLQRMMRKRHFAVPTVQTGMSEADLDKFCREYLQALVDNNLASLVITNDAVKIFRNYLILYTFQSVNEQVAQCVSLL
ncbi:uncharacterized protein [Montipora capricornis]|uniref:uncharacterized protein n=1 Tax=Montipora capricornis TaxID=246305 RepID=UPI0035F1C7D3